MNDQGGRTDGKAASSKARVSSVIRHDAVFHPPPQASARGLPSAERLTTITTAFPPFLAAETNTSESSLDAATAVPALRSSLNARKAQYALWGL